MTANLPATIHSPDIFEASAPPSFDGVFDWSWTNGCFGETNITPMDFDGVVERNGNFLVMETKREGASIPNGQLITLRRLHARGGVTVMLIWGKLKPIDVQVWPAKGWSDKTFSYAGGHLTCQEFATKVARRWFNRANQSHFSDVDVSILNRRVASLTNRIDRASEAAVLVRKQLVEAIDAANALINALSDDEAA